MRLPRRGSYRGRLAFDPDTGFHLDPAGRRVVTFDTGASWRYARKGDLSHNARHSRQVLAVESTANTHLELVRVHGQEIADQTIREQQPHHLETQVGDGHYDLTAPNLTRLKFHTDQDAPTVTSHTDAYAA